MAETRLVSQIRTRLAIAALPLTLLLTLHGVRYQELVERDAFRLAGSSEGEGARSGPMFLTRGRYRARVAIVRESAPSWQASPASVIASIGFVPEGALDARETVALRPLDFIRQGTREIDFTFKERSDSQRRWIWREAGGPSGLRIIRSEVLREHPLWRWPGGRDDSGRGAVLRLVLGFVWLVVLGWTAFYASRWRPTAESFAETTAARETLRPATLTLLGLLAYVLAGSALFSALYGAGSGPATGANVACRWLPQFDQELGSAPMGIIAALGVVAAALFGIVLRRSPALLWTLPLAALGLQYAGTLIGPKSDFQVYYAAGLALWAGTDPYAIRPERVLNPPPFVLACSVLPLLSLRTAGFLWFGLKAAAAAWCVPLARKGLVSWGWSHGEASRSSLPDSGVARRSRWWLSPEWLGLWAAARLIGMDLQFGNTNVLVLLALLVAAATWAQGRALATGMALAAGVALKATPALATLGIGLAGRVRWAIGVSLLSLGIVAMSAAALELRAHGAGWGFVREAVPHPDDLSLGRADNQSLRGLTDRMVGGAEIVTKTVRSVPSLQRGGRAARVAEGLLDAIVLSALVLLARRARRAGSSTGEGFDAWGALWAGATLAMLLLSPGSWTVHFALLYLPLVVLARRMLRGDRVAGAAFLTLALVIILPGTARVLSDRFTVWSSLTFSSLAALAALLVKYPNPKHARVGYPF